MTVAREEAPSTAAMGDDSAAVADDVAYMAKLAQGPYCCQSAATLRGHRSYVRALCFHPSQDLCVSAAADQCLRAWDAASMCPIRDDGTYDVRCDDGGTQVARVPRSKLRLRRNARQVLKAEGAAEPEKLQVGTEVELLDERSEGTGWRLGVVVVPENAGKLRAC